MIESAEEVVEGFESRPPALWSLAIIDRWSLRLDDGVIFEGIEDW